MYLELLESKREEIAELGFVIPDKLTEAIASSIVTLYEEYDKYPVALLVNHQKEISDLFVIKREEFRKPYAMELAIDDVLRKYGFNRDDILQEGKRQYVIREARKLGMVFLEGDVNVHQS